MFVIGITTSEEFEEPRNICKNAGISFSGGRQSLQVELTILSDGCGGCRYCEFPYEAAGKEAPGHAPGV